MTTVKFNTNGGCLTAKAVFEGDMVANYEITLRDKDSNSQSSLLKGDNLNPQDDEVTLPSPPSINDGRRVVLETGFTGNHPDASPAYKINLEIHQDGACIGTASDSGTLDGKGQFSLLFIKLTT